MRVLRLLDKFSKLNKVYAHCDVPCGIYETDTMIHGVETVKSMTQKLLDLKDPKDLSQINTAVRMVQTKEEWAQKIKSELLILWTDHFKPEHLEKWPDLHAKIWTAAKTCSMVKREVSMKHVEELETQVKEIAKIFAESKQ